MTQPSCTWHIFKYSTSDGDNPPITASGTFVGTCDDLGPYLNDRCVTDFPDGDFEYNAKFYYQIYRWIGTELQPIEGFMGTPRQVQARMNELADDPGGSYTATGDPNTAP